jgi:23S rRNA pseudouridine1911/1915/1917 synthase
MPPRAESAAAEGITDADDPIETRQTLVEARWHGQRLDKLLVALAPEFSRSHLQGLIAASQVWIDEAPGAQASQRLRAGQQVRLRLLPTEESRAFRPEPMAITVLYEDEHLLVIDKPAGLVVHPAAGNWSGTLLNGLLARDPAAAALPRAGIVHRLDKDTSGLMLVGRTLPAVTALVRAIAAREVGREYLAIVHGRVTLPAFSVNAPIGRDPRSRLRMAVVAAGREARTDVSAVASGDAYSALRCTLHTGRTHQIRVHLAHRRHPLVSDPLYGGAAALGLVRQALHAAQLSLLHPINGRPLRFERAAPPDFAAAWAQALSLADPAAARE